MAEKLKNRILFSPYFWTGIFLFLFLIVFSYQKEQLIEREAEKRIKTIAKNVSLTNIYIFKNILTYYIDRLEYITYNPHDSDRDIKETIEFLSGKDSIFRDVELITLSEPLQLSYRLKPQINDSLSCLQFIFPMRNHRSDNKALRLNIELQDLHKKIAEDKNFSHAYLTLIHKNRYIFHPDERKIGTFVEKEDLFIFDKENLNSVITTYSDYLKLPVYRYFEKVEIGGEEWIFAANVPEISFYELVLNTQNAFIYMSVLMLVAFAIIFFLGLLHWQKELFKRQRIQEEKINLELKNEQHKRQVLITELEQLKSGLNPHFLFNSLSSLKILVNKKPEEAQCFAVALSDLYSYLLRQEKCDVISFKEELTFTKNYIYLQQIRFSERIKVEINIDEQDLHKKLPPISLQLLVENCIKHTKITPKENLIITISSNDNYIIIKNNYNPIQNIFSSGIGLENLKKRYSYLTRRPCSFYIQDEQFVASIPLL